MELNNNTVLDGKYTILNTISKVSNYIYYSAVDDTGTNLIITEFFPPDCTRNDDGIVTIPMDRIQDYESLINKIVKNITQLVDSNLNKFVRTTGYFEEHGTVYIVNEAIHGEDMIEFMSKEEDPEMIESVFKSLFGFLQNMKETIDEEVYLSFLPSYIYITKKGEFRILQNDQIDGSEEKVVSDIVSLLYLVLEGELIDDEGQMVRIAKKNYLSKKYKSFIKALLNTRKTKGNKLDVFLSNMVKAFEKDIKDSEKKINNPKINNPIIMISIIVILILLFTGSCAFFIGSVVTENPMDKYNEEINMPEKKVNIIIDK